VDSDHDGLPDWWELMIGTNPNSASGDFSDSNADPDGDGYSNLENYLNWLAAPHVNCGRNASVDVDLTTLTRGFTNASPAYAVSNPTNGTVSLVGRVAHFVPSAGFYGLGGFQFKVTDATGFSYTNAINVHVVAMPQSQLALSLSGGAPQLQFTGESGFNFLLQYSDDLVTPPGFPTPAARFYRAVSIQ
jgi:hypothetical protein